AGKAERERPRRAGSGAEQATPADPPPGVIRHAQMLGTRRGAHGRSVVEVVAARRFAAVGALRVLGERRLPCGVRGAGAGAAPRRTGRGRGGPGGADPRGYGRGPGTRSCPGRRRRGCSARGAGPCRRGRRRRSPSPVSPVWVSPPVWLSPVSVWLSPWVW